ncbi:hypothetical protein [Burkholderia sp. S-53]|uniref:hypothetical protein n=1 Tax=Burkholderia sp. S-53 TaxID=2906514 RepID=UPI0021D32384|nr:hypothetical protein [Burkholderia sp. S-53]UXU91924.1 hypothetical protein LXM88_27595 [Burkholderia sp. S-53]
MGLATRRARDWREQALPHPAHVRVGMRPAGLDQRLGLQRTVPVDDERPWIESTTTKLLAI